MYLLVVALGGAVHSALMQSTQQHCGSGVQELDARDPSPIVMAFVADMEAQGPCTHMHSMGAEHTDALWLLIF